MVQSARDPRKRPDRAQLRHALGLSSDVHMGTEPDAAVDSAAGEEGFVTQALVALLEAASEVTTRLERLEATQARTAEAIAVVYESLHRNNGAVAQREQADQALSVVESRLDEVCAQLLDAIGSLAVPAAAAVDNSPDWHESASTEGLPRQQSAVVPTLQKLLVVARELQARPDLAPEVRRLAANLNAASARGQDDPSAV